MSKYGDKCHACEKCNLFGFNPDKCTKYMTCELWIRWFTKAWREIRVASGKLIEPKEPESEVTFVKRRTKNIQISGNTYYAESGVLRPTNFSARIEEGEDGDESVLRISNGIERWDVPVQDIISLLIGGR